ncbi:MAG: ExbD/TolR family protein [Bacteroidota bacterium]
MSKFSKGKKKPQPAISTASLPDIVFMLLFFFMVVTKLRDSELMVKVATPFATQLTKLEDKSLVNYLYIGRPVEKYKATYGTKPRLQLSDKFANINEIPIFLERFRVKIPEAQRTKITTSLRVDGQVTMGIVQDVKTELRKANQLKINY